MKSTLSILTLIAACLASASAFALSPPLQECSADADCADGEICAIYEYDCAPCLEGEECPPCASGTIGECVAAPEPIPTCNSDADCDAGDVCVSYTYEACAGRDVVLPCDVEGDEPCAMPPVMDDECESYSEAYCVPPYYAPCQADADCGPGFVCRTAEICSCSSGVDFDGNGEPNTMDDCLCEPSREMYCELIPVSCDSDADCESGLTCISEDLDVLIVTDENGDGIMDANTMPEPSSICAPEGYWGTPTTADKESSVGDPQGAERISWGATAEGGKPQAGCMTTGTSSEFGFFGLLGLVALRLRRRK